MASARSLLWLGVAFALLGPIVMVWWQLSPGWPFYTPYSIVERAPAALPALALIGTGGLAAVAFGRAALERRWLPWLAAFVWAANVVFDGVPPQWGSESPEIQAHWNLGLQDVGFALLALSLARTWPRAAVAMVVAFPVHYVVDSPWVWFGWQVGAWTGLAWLLAAAARDEPAGSPPPVPFSWLACALLVGGSVAFFAGQPVLGCSLALVGATIAWLGERPDAWLDAALGFGLMMLVSALLARKTSEQPTLMASIAPLVVPIAARSFGRAGAWLVALGLVPTARVLAQACGWL